MQSVRVALAAVIMLTGASTAALAQIGPANDSCGGAIGPLSIPSSTLGATIGTTPDAGLPACGEPNTAPGVWYRLIGTGNRITATTCNAPGSGGAASYDSRLTVFCGRCVELVCAAENDDNCVGGSNQFASTVSWCSQPGVEYRILVHGFDSTDFGTFTLRITDDGIPCAAEVVCVEIGACCLDDESCTDGVEILDCAALGGVFQGHQSQCGEPYYPVLSCTSAFEDISSAGNVAANASDQDDGGDDVPIGFTFNYFGQDHDTIMVRSNGLLTFGPGSVDDFFSVPLPSAGEPDNVIAPYWDDWSPDQAGTIQYQTLGDAPNRRFIAQWTGVERFEGAVGELATFQAVLFEGSNCIEFRYGAELFFGFPVVGVENQDGTVGTNVDLTEATAGGCVRLCQTGPIFCGTPGACCLPDGSCVLATQSGGEDCTALGGAYQGDGTDCNSASCPQPGACCSDGGSCTASLEVGGADCTGAGGVYQGNNTDCGSIDCSLPGACCLPNGSCELATEVGGGDCIAAGGAYQGDDTTCAAADCPQPGACCMESGSCTTASEIGGADCIAAGGVYQGDSTSCDSVNCTEPGACCMDDGSCSQATVLGGSDCTNAGGTYQGSGTLCATVTCAAPGACCMDDGSCALAAEIGGADCTNSGGAYQGDGTTCATANCPRPGACCMEDGSCTLAAEAGGADCTAAGGVYQGDDTTCATAGCAQPGACCRDDGSCVLAAEIGGADCTLLGGDYQGDDTNCTTTNCPPPPGGTGACCAPGGACSRVTEAECLASGGVFVGSGVSCFAADCPKPGACCLPDGSCRRLDEAGGADCIAAGGAYGGDDTNCLTVDCPRPGACCRSDGTCRRAEILGGADCTDAGGAYAGDGTDCHPDPCPQVSSSGPNPEPDPDTEPESPDNCTGGILPMLLPLMLFGWGWARRGRRHRA